MKNIKDQPAICFRNTVFGTMGVIWSSAKNSPKVSHILIPRPEITAEQVAAVSYPAAQIASCSEIDTLADQIEASLAGGAIRFSLDVLTFDRCTPFQHKVLNAVHAIPKSRVSSYGLIAKYLNKPGAARAVGTALATNPFPIIIPCHRTVRSDGHLGGFQGGLSMKRKLLQMEGVVFLNQGHIAPECILIK